MNCNDLLSKIQCIQNEYKELLIKISPFIDDENFHLVLFENSVFWTKHIRVIELYLEKHLTFMKSYLFADYVNSYDANADDYLYFSQLNGVLMFDDSLSRYSLAPLSELEKCKSIVSILRSVTQKNIDIISECGNEKLILPLSLIPSFLDHEITYNVICGFFCSLFDGIDTVDDYKEKCKTIQQVRYHLCKGVEDFLPLYEEDECTDDLTSRFPKAKLSCPDVLIEANNDAALFFYTVSTYFEMAIKVVNFYKLYGSTPFIQSRLLYRYVRLMSHSLMPPSSREHFEYSITVIHLAYHLFPSEKAEQDLITKNLKGEFIQSLFNKLSEHNISEKRYSVAGIISVLSDYFQEFQCAK